MTSDEKKDLQQRFNDGEIFIGNEHLMPTNIRQPMPSTAPTPPPSTPKEGDKK